MNTIAASFGADINDRVANTSGGRIEDIIGAREANGHGVDENIAVITFMELGFAADGWHANAVTIARDTFNHAIYKMTSFRMFRRAET